VLTKGQGRGPRLWHGVRVGGCCGKLGRTRGYLGRVAVGKEADVGWDFREVGGGGVVQERRG